MSQPDAKSLSEFLLCTLEYEMGLTVSVFESVPAERIDYRPDPMAKSALELLRHVTLEDEMFLNGIADGEFGPLPDDSDACGIMTPAEAAARYRERIPASIARVRAAKAEDLAKEIVFLGKYRMPAVQFLSMMVRHSVHHRGQLSTYIRPMGGKVPPIYGPSANTMADAAKAEAEAAVATA